MQSYGLEDFRFKQRYPHMIGSMLSKLRALFERELNSILSDMQRNYYVEGKLHLTKGPSDAFDMLVHCVVEPFSMCPQQSLLEQLLGIVRE